MDAAGNTPHVLTLDALRKPDLPTAPRTLDLHKVKDPVKRAAKPAAHDNLLAEYNEKKREYDEVLFPAYEQAYYRAYDQSEQLETQMKFCTADLACRSSQL